MQVLGSTLREGEKGSQYCLEFLAHRHLKCIMQRCFVASNRCVLVSLIIVSLFDVSILIVLILMREKKTFLFVGLIAAAIITLALTLAWFGASNISAIAQEHDLEDDTTADMSESSI